MIFFNICVTTGIQNTVVGARALGTADGDEFRNVAIGVDAMGTVNNNLSSPEFLNLFGRQPRKFVIRLRWIGKSIN